jgi:NH3-dependent NAD+ synthetase
LNYKITIKKIPVDLSLVVDETEDEFGAGFEQLDDCLFNMKFSIKVGGLSLEEEWSKEDNKIKKKLEKNAINQIKYRVAQQKRV